MTPDPNVIVIGAGIAGICVWDLLRKAGCSAVLLDAGPATVGPSDTLQSFVPNAEDWRWRVVGGDPDWLRVFAVGGRSQVWGQWCNRFSTEVFDRWRWPVSAYDMTLSYASAEAWFRVREESLSSRFSTLALRFGDRMSHRRAAASDNSPWLDALRDARLCAHTDAAALWLLADTAQAYGVEVSTPGGLMMMPASHFVVAASPAESARLLLGSGASHPEIGRNLTDHVGCGYMIVEPKERTSGYDGVMIRSARETRGTLLGGYTIEVVGPLRLDRDTANTLRENGIPAQPGMSAFAVLAMGEQLPRRNQRISLASGERDGLNRRVPVLQLECTHEDRTLVEKMDAECLEVVETLIETGMHLVELPRTTDAPRVFHPSGVAMMGSGEDSPTDTSGRLRQWSNVWVADASVFPSSGDCHPTLTVVAHAHRVAQSIMKDIQK